MHTALGDYTIPAQPEPAVPPTMLVPATALRILCRRTGGTLSRATFYRWIAEGRVRSMRLGKHIFIPLPALEELIRQYWDSD